MIEARTLYQERLAPDRWHTPFPAWSCRTQPLWIILQGAAAGMAGTLAGRDAGVPAQLHLCPCCRVWGGCSRPCRT